MIHAPVKPSVTRRALQGLAVVVAFALGLSVLALPRIERLFLTQNGRAAGATLTLAVEALEGALRRYQPLPALIAERPQLRALLGNPGNAELAARINEELRQTAEFVEASDIYVMDLTGLTIAASNADRERSFIGRSFAFRPYFRQAREGGLGRYFALGTTSLERGYFYAAPIRDGARIVGVVALKFTVDRFETSWRGGASDIIVTDSSDIVFMSNREAWHFRALSPLSDAAIAQIEATRQYPMDRILPLETATRPLGDRFNLISIAGVGEFITASHRIADAGWTVTILEPRGPARAQALIVLALMVLLILFGALIAGLFIQRRRRLVERLEQIRLHRELLEQRVAERTADLNHANRQLVQEIEDRKATEARLRKTQNDLVQAGKLAALGQMSAALSHEFNQPLAAVKVYAENAVTFLDRGRPEDARQNVTLISQMADRMASISKHLRNFARRPQEKIGPVPLYAVLDDALALMDAKLKSAKATVDYTRAAEDILVMGGQVRLQQVLVNLLSNALDAMETDAAPRIEISVRAQGDRQWVEVRDHGPGLTEESLTQLFDPFFTTKIPGKGLGLGLSISYNIVRDFGGTLAARNHPDGGAVFTVDLVLADPPLAQKVAAQ
ncbi:ATP-binding protein [Pararhodobacter sp.]|uniref:ATP-binding protein n=1 Tax=Pararhodobacter sp. TaxID=2127056 RepID=UPI002AFEBBAF|nr:ATP-binding protein [Pararhodobacter sp.]